MGFVRSTIANHIGTLTFFSEKSNSLPSDLLTDLLENIYSLSKKTQVKVIILKSEGEKTFCSGASFDELLRIDNEQEGLLFFRHFADIINAMKNSPKIILGRIHGKAVGGGVGLIAATDYSFATENAAVKLSEISIGIAPFVIGPVIQKKMGENSFCRLSLNAHQFFDAKWAQSHGLLTEVYPSVETMDKALWQLAKKLSQYNPDALEKLKQTFWEGTEHWDQLLLERARLSGRLILSDFTKAFIQNFKK